MAKVSAIILGAGLSKRMGTANKLFLPVREKPMIEWVIENVKASTADEIILVGSELSMDRLTRFEDEKIRVVENLHYKTGMTSSIQAGVEAARLDGYLICQGDQPYIQTSTYDQLIQSFQLNPTSIILPFFRGKRGNPVIFSKHYREEILAHREPNGCRTIIQKNSNCIIHVEVDDHGVLIDVDTREDYNKFYL